MGEKLVRDKIPDIIREKGESPQVRVAKPDELDALLREKIVEEAKEFLLSGDTEELVDIQEAIEALLKLRKADPALIEIQRHSKLLARGGFTKGYVLTMKQEDEWVI
ncbi:MAG: nucleoside triphosphate pyrophosphohydrolase [Candidatus Thorarchaeota archaeon]